MLVLALVAGEASAQTLGQASDDGVSLWRVAGAFALCIVLGIGAVLALRARGGALPAFSAKLSFAGFARKERRLQLVEVLRLNQHVDLCIVRCDDTAMLLAACTNGAAILPWPQDARASEPADGKWPA
jgi:hypothetical protein